jgi:2-C-methyl-D-erythritol 4-phosphate cytidylyltransferase
MKTVAVIPAAGAGVRMGANRAKQFLDLQDRSVLSVTLERFQLCSSIDSVILVVPAEDLDYCKKDIVDEYKLSKVEKIIPGGARRQDSVRLGIEASKGDYPIIIIHDGVRPFIDQSIIEDVVSEAHGNRAVITGLPAKETVKEINEHGIIQRTYKREHVWLVQTPQAFRYDDIMAAHKRALKEDWGEATDDSFLIEKMGIPVKIIRGSEKNIKVTTPYDLKLARFLMEKDG